MGDRSKIFRRARLLGTRPLIALTGKMKNRSLITTRWRISCRLIVLFLLIVLLGSCEEIREIREKETAVRQVFVNYKTAVLDMNGNESVTYLTQNSLEFYDDLVQSAK
jgi:hypothetical protein